MCPRLLDLFAGAGGAAQGYANAGFEVVGVDLFPQPDYPFEFIQADALKLSKAFISTFDAIHASPPCQAFTAMKAMHNAKPHLDLITPTRERLRRWGGPYVMENVPGAPLLYPVLLCGSMFGLGTETHQLRRHRLFETTWGAWVPTCKHDERATIGIYGGHIRDRRRRAGDRGVDFTGANGFELAKQVMGMPWVRTWDGVCQAIPPAYTEFLGKQLLTML